MPSPELFEIHAEMHAFAERSFEQAKFAFDKFMETVQSTMNPFEGQSKVTQDGTKEISKRIMNLAEQNVVTAFEYAQKLVRAKDPKTLIALQGEYISAQMCAFCEQATALRDIASTVAAE